MGKLISELKPGDTVYSLSIHNLVRTAMCVDNANNVLRSLGVIDYMTSEINVSEICELRLKSIDHIRNTISQVNNENLYILFYDKPFEGLYSQLHGNVSCYAIRNHGFNYKLYSTNKEDLIEKARNVLTALKVVQDEKHIKQKNALNNALLNIEKL